MKLVWPAVAATIGVAFLSPRAATAETRAPGDAVDRLQDLSIEQLADVEVTTVARRRQPLSEAPSSVFVIGPEDIRRSGAVSLPEVLRLAPNLQVARVDARDYAISARGMNSFETANKLLVLIDGRSVMSPLYAGVEWDQQLPPLEDVERIEVVSGPGGALWGANAVNGVINVVSRSAFDTQGVAASLHAGGLDQRLHVRYGGAVGDSAAYRVYFVGFGQGATRVPRTGQDARDAWGGVEGGFRGDLRLAAGDLTVQGDLYSAGLQDLFTSGERLGGGNLLARWRQPLAGGGLEVQAYYDQADRVARGISESTRSYDLEARFNRVFGRHTLLAGAGARASHDQFDNRINAAVLVPSSRWVNLFNVFAQDEVALTDSLSLTAGLKFEQSSFHGSEWAPSLRMAWRPSEHALVWAAVSRAIRSPSRVERELVIPPFVVKGSFGPEAVVAYEAGIRATPNSRLSFSVSAYFNRYDDIRSNAFTPVVVFPVWVANGVEGETWGLEAWGDFAAASWWRLSAGVSTLHKDFRVKAGQNDLSNLKAAGNDPDYQVLLGSTMRLPGRLELAMNLRWIDDLPKPAVDGYVDIDARLAWRATDAVELAVGARNLADDGRLESSEPRSTETRRDVYLETRWRF